MSQSSPSSTPIQQTRVDPEVLPKWTIVNDEWVQTYRHIVRTGSGFREIPQQAIARSESK